LVRGVWGGGPEWSLAWKVIQRFPASVAAVATDGRGDEGGGSAGGQQWAEGAVAAHPTVMRPPWPEPDHWGVGEPREAMLVQPSAAWGSV